MRQAAALRPAGGDLHLLAPWRSDGSVGSVGDAEFLAEFEELILRPEDVAFHLNYPFKSPELGLQNCRSAQRTADPDGPTNHLKDP